MRGKKVDNKFVSDFITECIKKNINSPEDMLKEAKTKIEIINKKIVEVEQLKIKRNKLLDVITTFDKYQQDNKMSNNDSKLLPLFNIKNTHICKFICDHIKTGIKPIESLLGSKYSNEDIYFSIKQLIEYKVLSKRNDNLLIGDMFQDYVKHILQG